MMISTGLTEQNLTLLKQLFAHYPNISIVKLYGSRAKGTFKQRSDIDLVVFGDKIDRFLIAELLLELADSDLPYKVDLQNYDDLKNRQLIAHIDLVGRVIYDKTRN